MSGSETGGSSEVSCITELLAVARHVPDVSREARARRLLLLGAAGGDRVLTLP